MKENKYVEEFLNVEGAAGCSLMFLNHVEVVGRALVRCPVLDEDPGGTEHV